PPAEKVRGHAQNGHHGGDEDGENGLAGQRRMHIRRRADDEGWPLGGDPILGRRRRLGAYGTATSLGWLARSASRWRRISYRASWIDWTRGRTVGQTSADVLHLRQSIDPPPPASAHRVCSAYRAR